MYLQLNEYTMTELKDQLTALIVDDESHARKVLGIYLQHHCPEVKVLGEAASVPEAVKAIRKLGPDVVFLDIGMPGLSGLQLLEFFEEEEITFSLVFITAYREYAIKAFRLSAIDYLEKPLQLDQLLEAVAKVKQQKISKQQVDTLIHNLQHQAGQRLHIPTLEGEYILPLESILYIKAEGAYSEIHVLDQAKTITASKHLKHFEEALKEVSWFQRTHRSFLVNSQFIRSIKRGKQARLILSNGKELPVSKQFTSQA